MTSVADVRVLLETHYPAANAAEWDVVGAVCGADSQTVSRILLAIDPTHAVLDQAVDLGAQLVVVHHPLHLKPIEHIKPGSVLDRFIRAGVALHVVHTNGDVSRSGTSDALCAALGLGDSDEPIERTDGGVGFGRFVSAEMSLRELADRAAHGLPRTAGGVRLAGDPERKIRRVAAAAGAGDDAIEAAAAQGADVLITSDLRHHRTRDALDLGLAMIDVPHWAAEWPWLHTLKAQIEQAVKLETVVSQIVTDPWCLRLGVDG